jgi:hypothetical protein
MAVLSDITVVVAAGGALAAAVSARSSARGVALSHRPYLYGEGSVSAYEERSGSSATVVSVRLHNDGPGTAVEVRWRVVAAGDRPPDWAPDPIRAMQPGEVLPPEGRAPMSMRLPIGVDGQASGWYIETEFSDIRDARWRLTNDRGTPAAPARPKRVKTGRLDVWRLPSD